MPEPGSAMTPVHRDDGELIGLIEPRGGLWVPCTVFGYPLAGPVPREQAEEELHSHGLGYLADRWEVHEDGAWITAEIVEAKPYEVTLSFVDYGHPELFNLRRSLIAPTPGELRRQ